MAVPKKVRSSVSTYTGGESVKERWRREALEQAFKTKIKMSDAVFQLRRLLSNLEIIDIRATWNPDWHYYTERQFERRFYR